MLIRWIKIWEKEKDSPFYATIFLFPQFLEMYFHIKNLVLEYIGDIYLFFVVFLLFFHQF